MHPLVHDAMLTSAQGSPYAPAIEFADRQLTYSELDAGSASIALALTPSIKTEETCIAIFMDKRLEAILALYGILRAGAAYVPLDTKNPASRIQHIISQCGITTFITTPDFAGQLDNILAELDGNFECIIVTEDPWTPTISSHSYQIVNAFQSQLTAPAVIDHVVGVDKADSANQLAAVLYTSGSTGTPKGVMITHANISVFTNWVVSYFSLSSDDRLASHAPLYFDLSLLDIFAAHHCAATAVLIPETMVGNPRYLTQFIVEKQISSWQSVPTALTLMLKYGGIDQHQYPQLRHVLFAGERMSTQNVQGLTEYFRAATFHNIYGSTETNDTFIFSFAATLENIPDPLPIGRPLPYVEYRIDKGDKNIPGEEGELLVKAPTLMRGYRGQSAINSGGNIDSIPYYRTSDFVKVLNNGDLEFIGRTDDVVKSNGYRINLLAIESVLQNHEAIQEVAVLSIPDEDMGNKIIAVITTPSTDTISAIALRLYCAEHLPKYAIPHLFEIRSQSLPKTSSGKTNKKSLIQLRCNHVEHS
ncbi:amino acid adenylation domain-containing protein [Maricurvus nonylphenolicus]|uniref:amino acid adenylation domain-containing protein n=1 Tax=Maricurvus nonylphenolicus TaxID=1008307 RepID=UPI0036F41A0D